MTDMIAKDNWYTPHGIAEKVQRFYPNGFLDPASCSEANKVMGATRFYSGFQTDRDALIAPWDYHSVWLNPPYSQPLLSKFISRVFETRGTRTGWVEALVLVNSSTGSKWFHRLANQADARLDIKGRIKFWSPAIEGKKPDRPRYDNVLFYFGEYGADCYRFMQFQQIFGELGLVYGRPYRDH